MAIDTRGTPKGPAQLQRQLLPPAAHPLPQPPTCAMDSSMRSPSFSVTCRDE